MALIGAVDANNTDDLIEVHDDGTGCRLVVHWDDGEEVGEGEAWATMTLQEVERLRNLLGQYLESRGQRTCECE